MKRTFRNKQDRQGVQQLGRTTTDNEYKSTQRNPEPTTKISPPPVPTPGQVAARFDAPIADGDGRATGTTVGTETPYVPLPHESPEWTETPEGQIMRLAELVAIGEVQSIAVQGLIKQWLTENADSIPTRNELQRATSFFFGRLRKAVMTVEEAMATAIVDVVPPDDPKRRRSSK